MQSSGAVPSVTVCLLAFGDYPQLVSQALDSMARYLERSHYELIVGANAVCAQTRDSLERAHRAGTIDKLIVSSTNLSKCPMMRRMFAHVRTEYIWWFDDDSYLTEPGAMSHWLKAASTASTTTVLWGQSAWCEHRLGFSPLEDVVGFVRSAPWYRGVPPPSWRPGGKGEFNFRGEGRGDGRWIFISGGCWLIRTSAVRALDWPDRRLGRHGDDVFLGEAIRQQGWELGDIGTPGVAMNRAPRRGEPPASTPKSHIGRRKPNPACGGPTRPIESKTL